MLAGKRRSHQVQGVGKQELCMLWLVVDQGQLQIVQVRPDEAEIDRLIGSHEDHLSRKGCSGGIRQLHEVYDRCVEMVILRSPLSAASENAKGTPWYLFWRLGEPEKSTKRSLPYAWLLPSRTMC